ncbi:MAG: D-alanine--D-alanine ligase [Pseudomonadota bacterium]|nr:D-alanine--D-alanine ligase [Pseudomonadota bacterium]
MSKHIAVLLGGWSAEREVSLVSGKAVARALRDLGYEVTEIDVQPDVAEVLARVRPDAAFNALHGRFGEDGCMQGLLEMMKIPYTHSGVLASSVAMDKPLAKIIFASAGLRCPKGKMVSRKELAKGDPLPRPFVVKPANEGSSVGVHIVTSEDNRPIDIVVSGQRSATSEENMPGRWPLAADRYLVEEYIPGREITAAVLNDKPLGVTEIKPQTGFYDYEHKYTDGAALHLCPAPLPKNKYEEVMQLALAAHRALGCRGLTRSDFRYDGKHFYLLEINTQPGMTPLSLSPEIAAHAGIDFKELVKILVEDAKLGEV